MKIFKSIILTLQLLLTAGAGHYAWKFQVTEATIIFIWCACMTALVAVDGGLKRKNASSQKKSA